MVPRSDAYVYPGVLYLRDAKLEKYTALSLTLCRNVSEGI